MMCILDATDRLFYVFSFHATAIIIGNFFACYGRYPAYIMMEFGWNPMPPTPASE